MTRLALSAFALVLLASPVLADPCEGPKVTAQIRLDSPGVVDGDTLRANGQRYRLWGVNAVERGQPGYAEAGRVLAGLTRETLRCDVVDVDRYRRPVVRCFNRKGDVGAQLVAAGAAVDWPRYSNGYYGAGCRR